MPPNKTLLGNGIYIIINTYLINRAIASYFLKAHILNIAIECMVSPFKIYKMLFISDDLNWHRLLKNYNPISNIDNDAHVILLQIRCLTWSISQTVFVPFRVLSEEVRLVDDIKYISTMNYLYIFTFVFQTFSHGCFSKVSNQ